MKIKFATIIILFALAGIEHAQVVMDRFKIDSAALLSAVKELRAANPKLSADDWVNAANVLIEKQGFLYRLYPDAATCEKIKKMSDARKDPKTPLNLGTSFQSIGAHKADMYLPEPKFTSTECGSCYFEIPVLEITPQHFVTVIKGQNIKFALPGNFGPTVAALIDVAGGNKVKKKWLLPYRTTPIGVAHDDNVIYIGLNDPALSDISLAIFGEGVFQFATTKEALASGTGKPLAAGTGVKAIQFEQWQKKFTVIHHPLCSD